MWVMVTGATGFIGSNVVKALLKRNIKVIVLVRDINKINEEWKENVVYIKFDMCCESDYSKLKDYPIDTFFHFSWMGTAGEMRKDIDCQLDNVKYSCRLMKSAKEAGCKRFIYAGSIMEYEVMNYLIKDSSLPSAGMIYSTAKLTADFMLKTLANTLEIEYINVLISNVYGAGERSSRFLNTTLRKMLKNESIELTQGKQLYDFIYISDAVNAIVSAAFNGKAGTSYYIGNKNQIELREYIEKMKKIVNSNSELLFGKIPFYNAMLSYKEFDTGKVEDELSIIYEYDFEKGILEMVKELEKNE